MENMLLAFFCGLVIGVVAGRLKYRAKLDFYRRFIHEQLSLRDAAAMAGTGGFNPRTGFGESRLENVELTDDRQFVSSPSTNSVSHYKN